MPLPSTNINDLTGLSQPVTVLIEKISEAVGVLWEPFQIKRIAKANAKAALINAESYIEITEVGQRALRRLVNEEIHFQQNMEEVIDKALPKVTEEATPDAMDNDWITNFFAKCRMVSDREMQSLWAHILAGEANVPGTYSKRTVSFIAELDKSEAVLFNRLCGFIWQIGETDDVPLVFDRKAEIYKKHGLNFDSLQHLESIGLIRHIPLPGFVEDDVPKRFIVTYYGRELVLELPKDAGNELVIGEALLTRVGKELLPICESVPVEGFWEYVMDQWKQYLPKA